MKRPLAMGLPLIVILALLTSALSEPSPNSETITGHVVAYSDGLACLNGNAYWLMLIHASGSRAKAKFIQVRFSLPCDETPQWLNRESPTQEFHLKREQSEDSVLKEFRDCVANTMEKCQQMPMWKLVPGVHEKLPFGQSVPTYRSVNLPLVPVV